MTYLWGKLLFEINFLVEPNSTRRISEIGFLDFASAQCRTDAARSIIEPVHHNASEITHS